MFDNASIDGGYGAQSAHDTDCSGAIVLHVPGDKSIAHRILMIASMRGGQTRISHVPCGYDVAATIRVLRQLGASIEHIGEGEYLVQGWGERGPEQPDSPLDCANSATTARLIMGVIAPWGIEVTITGDDSLQSRPMGRVCEPLAMMGARFDGDVLPLTMRGTSCLQGISYEPPISSAQVKSAVLLAGLHATGQTTICEAFPSRSHTELLLAQGWFARHDEMHYEVPGDPSSASFLLVAAMLLRVSEVCIEGVCLNPTRLGFMRVLCRMGANVRCVQTGEQHGEPVGCLYACASGKEWHPCATTIEACEIPQLIDEVPIVALIAACAHGRTVFRGVDELRVKESDRLKAIADGLASLGIDVSFDDGPQGIEMAIDGKPELFGDQGLLLPEGTLLDAQKDHRLALTWLVARECSVAHVAVKDAGCAAVSYPTFVEDMSELKAKGLR